jgi:hypothetical protein
VRPSRWLVRAIVAVLAITAIVGIVACGGGQPEQEQEQQAQEQVPEDTLAVTLGAGGELTGVKELPAGPVTVEFANDAPQPHELQMIRVDGDHSIEEVLEVISSEGEPIPGWIHGAGGVGSVAPGQTSTSTQVLESGRHFLIAQLAAEGEEPPVTAELEVSDGQARGKLPEASARIDAFEYGFRPEGLKPGRQEVEFNNTGGELHHVQAFPLRPGASLDEAKEFFESEEPPEGEEPPLDFEGAAGTPVLDGGTKQVLEMELRPGKYALVCFIPDRSGGKPHLDKGMIDEVEVE